METASHKRPVEEEEMVNDHDILVEVESSRPESSKTKSNRQAKTHGRRDSDGSEAPSDTCSTSSTSSSTSNTYNEERGKLNRSSSSHSSSEGEEEASSESTADVDSVDCFESDEYGATNAPTRKDASTSMASTNGSSYRDDATTTVEGDNPTTPESSSTDTNSLEDSDSFKSALEEDGSSLGSVEEDDDGNAFASGGDTDDFGASGEDDGCDENAMNTSQTLNDSSTSTAATTRSIEEKIAATNEDAPAVATDQDTTTTTSTPNNAGSRSVMDRPVSNLSATLDSNNNDNDDFIKAQEDENPVAAIASPNPAANENVDDEKILNDTEVRREKDSPTAEEKPLASASQGASDGSATNTKDHHLIATDPSKVLERAVSDTKAMELLIEERNKNFLALVNSSKTTEEAPEVGTENKQQKELSVVPYGTNKYGNDATKDDESESSNPDDIVAYKKRPSASSIHHPHPSHARRRSSMSSLPQFQELNPEEEDRRRREVDTAMEILKHMRRANLVLEFGPGVDLDACVFCLRQEQQQAKHSPQKPKQQPKRKNRLQQLLPRKKHKQCLICHSPVCHQHWDQDFVHQQNVILCPDCAPLFDLDHLMECMNTDMSPSRRNKNEDNHSSKTSTAVTTVVDSKQLLVQRQEHMRRLMLVYDRALLALRHSSQSFDDNARQRIEQTNWHKEGLGIGSTVTNIASGLTGLAATAVFMTPMGPWLLLTSLALSGVATAVGTGSFFMDRLCPHSRQAEQTIALASMVDSLLEATTILRHARITGTMPRHYQDDDDSTTHDDDDDSTAHDDDDDSSTIICIDNARRSKLLLLSSSNSPHQYLQQDKEQQLMITILKAKKEREQEAERKNPLKRFIQRRVAKVEGRARERGRRRRGHKRFDSDARLDRLIEAVDQEEKKKRPWTRAAGRFKRNVNTAKDKAATVASVTRTATKLAAVGMSAGRKPSSSRRSTLLRPVKGPVASDPSATTESGHRKNEGLCKRVSKREAARRASLQTIANNFFAAAAESSNNEDNTNRQADDDEEESKRSTKSTDLSKPGQKRTNKKGPLNFDLFGALFGRNQKDIEEDEETAKERALVTHIRQKNSGLRLRASSGILKAFTRTNCKVAVRDSFCNEAQRRRQRLLDESEMDPDAPSVEDRIFMKNARFVVKASLTVLRETARFAGGAFSATIVFVETMELKGKVEQIRDGKVRCENADKLDKLKQNLWQNHDGFPDSRTLETELLTDYRRDGHGQHRRQGSYIPPWSDSFEGQRPDGSCSNLAVMKCS